MLYNTVCDKTYSTAPHSTHTQVIVSTLFVSELGAVLSRCYGSDCVQDRLGNVVYILCCYTAHVDPPIQQVDVVLGYHVFTLLGWEGRGWGKRRGREGEGRGGEGEGRGGEGKGRGGKGEG